MRTVTTTERRRRLARRHALAPEHRVQRVEAAAEQMVCLHATDPSTIALSAWVRVEGFQASDLERALYTDRTLVKHLAMRRTLFVFPRATLAGAHAGASLRVAEQERKRLIGDVERSELAADGEAWLQASSAEILAHLAGGQQRTARELRAELPVLQAKIIAGSGKWATEMSVGPRLLTVLGASGQVVRGTNDGGWHVSRPRWSSMEAWLGEPLAAHSVGEGVTGLVERWLRAFGPGSTNDIKWWLGGTVKATKQALADLAAVEVSLEGGGTGWLLPDDLEPEPAVEPWGALLPSLDPTTMGWKERDWYLGDYKAQLFDYAGNAGPTIWWDGRIVGGWRQDADGVVELQWLEDVGSDARAALEADAARLTEWFGGLRVMLRFPSPLSK
ncbi:MAG: AlkZ family DNA glycosylase, partial [Solirubrobacteraceae bacterium]|nr:AlkZ family DNA glycosylase [Solirubrobacteraceae bacterium]